MFKNDKGVYILYGLINLAFNLVDHCISSHYLSPFFFHCIYFCRLMLTIYVRELRKSLKRMRDCIYEWNRVELDQLISQNGNI